MHNISFTILLMFMNGLQLKRIKKARGISALPSPPRARLIGAFATPPYLKVLSFYGEGGCLQKCCKNSWLRLKTCVKNILIHTVGVRDGPPIGGYVPASYSLLECCRVMIMSCATI